MMNDARIRAQPASLERHDFTLLPLITAYQPKTMPHVAESHASPLSSADVQRAFQRSHAEEAQAANNVAHHQVHL